MKQLLLTASYLAAAICVAAMTTQSASAQCNYRMNDVGRSHGYLSGPCNGAAQGYSGAYPSRQARFYHPDGSVTQGHPGLRTVRTGNTVRVYNSSGQLTATVIKRGNMAHSYDARGRLSRRAVFGPNGTAIYDMRGRQVSFTPDIRR
jgi:YD repeat-containing protein